MSDRDGVIITGGARRIGAALARHFAQHGYDIALHYHTSGGEALVLKNDIEALGVSCILFEHDLADIVGIPALMGRVQAAMPHCSVLVNNASIFERATLMETDEALLERQFAVNFKAPFFLSQAFAKYFGQGGIVNVLDTDVVQTNPSHFAYLLSKKALADFTPMAARALGPHIRVNAVCPGCILPSNSNDESYEMRLESVIPLQSHPGVKELAESVLWLAGQTHITGQMIFVDGGKHVL